MNTEKEYKFLEIKDAITSLNQKVNLIGVIINHGIAKKSRGTDFNVTLKIIDESHQSPGISVNFFAENMKDLPQVESCGDIVLLSNVEIKTHDNIVYVRFHKRISSFSLFEGKYGKDFVPYQVSRKFNYRSKDEEFVAGIRRWLDVSGFDTGDKEAFSMKELKQGMCINFVCKILHTCKVAKGEWMAFVWDGTDAPPVTIESRLADEFLLKKSPLEDEKKLPLPLQLEQVPLTRDVICMFPSVGTVLRVITDGGDGNLGLSSLIIGKWVKFLNMKVELRAGLWCGKMMRNTKVRYLPNEDSIVSQRERSNDQRLKSKWDRMPFSSFDWPSSVTEVDLKHSPFVTLMDVLTHSEVTAKFRCVVRVVSIFPWQAEHFISPSGIYRIRLTLEDPTARIHAFVYAEDGDKFFEGRHPINILKRKRNAMLGVAESDEGKETELGPRNPPWIQCCLKSYWIEESDPWGSRNYRIFDTKLVG